MTCIRPSMTCIRLVLRHWWSLPNYMLVRVLLENVILG
jgi:hypothetical protein